MATGIDEAVRAVAGAESGLGVHPVSTESLEVGSGAVVIDGVPYALGDEGLSSICKGVGAPASYVAKLGPEMRSQLLRYHVERGDLGADGLAAFTREGELLAFGRADLALLRGHEVLAAVVDGVGRGSAEALEVHGLHVGALGFEVELVSQQIEHVAAPGDVMRAGLHVVHSFVGETATVVETFLLRLVCTNGMTHRDCVSRRPARTRRVAASNQQARELMRAQVRRLSEDAWGGLQGKLAEVARLREERVDVAQLLRQWVARARLEGMVGRLLEAWQTEGAEGTAFGAMNALTRVATHDDTLSPRARRALSRLAGVLAFRHQHLCPRCFAPISGVT